jgi:hypothetical protein
MNGSVRVAVVALAWTLPLCISRAAEPEVELAGIHIGQPLDQVRHALSGKASFEKEDEGQQVWRVLRDPAVRHPGLRSRAPGSLHHGPGRAGRCSFDLCAAGRRTQPC